MKLLSLIALTILAACSGKHSSSSAGGTVRTASSDTASGLPCANLPVLGLWYNNMTGDYLTLNASCGGENTLCEYDFTYSVPDNTGLTFVDLTYSNHVGGCMTAGPQTCTLTTPNAVTLEVDCGSGVLTYRR
jgi:hypothetical protein